MKKLLSLAISLMCMLTLLSVGSIPAKAASAACYVTTDGSTREFSDLVQGWCYAVYSAKSTGREAVFKLNTDYTAWTSKGSKKYNGKKYKYSKYDFGVDLRQCDMGVGLGSTNEVDAFRGGALYIQSGAKIKLDLNGHCIDRKEGSSQRDDGEVIQVAKGGTLTIVDSNPKAPHDGFSGGGIMRGSSGDGAGGIHVKGTLNMKAGTIYKCNTDEHGGGIYVAGSGTVNMTGGAIIKCETDDSWDWCHGGAIYITDGGKCNLSNCVIRECESEDYGGAIYLDDGKLVCDNVRFINNYSTDEGGAIYFDEGKGEIRNCLFHGNGADDDGGAVYVDSSDTVILCDNTFTENSTTGDGGALYINRDNVVVSGAVMTGNTAKNHGGAIYVDSFNDLNLQGYCVIKDNNSKKKHTKNIALQDGTATRAYLYPGSIEEGSCIHIASTGGGSQPITKKSNLSQYQYSHYFVADGSSSELKNLKEVRTPFITSVFSQNGGFAAIIAGCVIIAAAAVYCVTLSAKKKKAGERRANNEER